MIFDSCKQKWKDSSVPNSFTINGCDMIGMDNFRLQFKVLLLLFIIIIIIRSSNLSGDDYLCIFYLYFSYTADCSNIRSYCFPLSLL
jgi:hypothetical protein